MVTVLTSISISVPTIIENKNAWNACIKAKYGEHCAESRRILFLEHLAYYENNSGQKPKHTDAIACTPGNASIRNIPNPQYYLRGKPCSWLAYLVSHRRLREGLAN